MTPGSPAGEATTPPTFTTTIGSAGRPSLPRTLESIARQRRLPGDQCFVGFDELAFRQNTGTLELAIRMVESYGPGFIGYSYLGIADAPKTIPPPWGDGSTIPPGQPYGWLGVEQINSALRGEQGPITGSHVFTLGDDDVFVDGAYDILREVCAKDPLRPVIYKFVAPNRWLLWDRPRMRSCLISGCCIAAPRKYVGLHPTDIETTHDYRWMMAINDRAAAAGKAPLWYDWVGVIARPDPWGADVKHAGVYQCPLRCGEWRFYEDFRSTNMDRCPWCGTYWEDFSAPRIVEPVDPALGNWYEQEGRR
jgi:hypothetical protein